MTRVVHLDTEGYRVLVGGHVLRPRSATIAWVGARVKVLGWSCSHPNFGQVVFPSGHTEYWWR